MSEQQACPNCGEGIDPVKACVQRECPECEATYTELVRQATDDYEPPEIEYPHDGPGGAQ
jgi:predicted RNA-binding Zn-ribbon protein involved in translation (DUF1610 family)